MFSGSIPSWLLRHVLSSGYTYFSVVYQGKTGKYFDIAIIFLQDAKKREVHQCARPQIRAHLPRLLSAGLVRVYFKSKKCTLKYFQKK